MQLFDWIKIQSDSLWLKHMTIPMLSSNVYKDFSNLIDQVHRFTRSSHILTLIRCKILEILVQVMVTLPSTIGKINQLIFSLVAKA